MLPSDFKPKVGAELFNKYSSLAELLMAIYPEFPWDPNEFKEAKLHYWRDNKNILKELSKAEEKIGMKEVQFYSVISIIFLYFLLHK